MRNSARQGRRHTCLLTRRYAMKETIRQILAEVARLDVPIETLDDQADLYQAGLSSLATVHVMLALENAFNIEIPDPTC